MVARKIKIIDVLLFFLLLTIIKCFLIPEIIRKILKLIIVIVTALYISKYAKAKLLLNTIHMQEKLQVVRCSIYLQDKVMHILC
jgi:hypothetical protein